ncbi:hypothetical protein PICSAR35_03931 [Mycobacterium avium subsp. paratuberculosis]|nr:hypothetical protein PICSAR35_03931 [Mycobacterium avium subsp. paratuberculosis]
MRRGGDRNTEKPRQRGGDGGQIRPAARRHHRGEITDPVARQRFPKHADEAAQRGGDRVVEFGSGEPDFAAHPGQPVGQGGRGVGGQLLLGHPAPAAQPAQRADGRGAGGECAGGRHIGDHDTQQRLVDHVAGEIAVPHGRGQRPVVAVGVHQRDAGAAAAEIADGHGSARRQARAGPHRQQGRGGVGDQHDGPGASRPFRDLAERGAQGLHRRRLPVRRVGDGDVVGLGAPAGGGVGQRPQRVGQQYLAAVHRAVGRDDGPRVADPVDEAGDHHAGPLQPGILGGHADLGGPVRIPGQDGLAGDGVIGGDGRQVGGADRQAQCGPSSIGHV